MWTFLKKRGYCMLEQRGLTKVTIPLPFRLDHVNCYLAEGENGWMVMDTGLNRGVTREMWAEYIAGKEISDIVITHYHPDHYGYPGALQQKTGARLTMKEITERAGEMAWSEDFIHDILGYYLDAGIPRELAGAIVENTKAAVDSVLPHPRVDHYLQEGEKIRIGRLEYEVISTPGHAEGM